MNAIAQRHLALSGRLRQRRIASIAVLALGRGQPDSRFPIPDSRVQHLSPSTPPAPTAIASSLSPMSNTRLNLAPLDELDGSS